MERIFNKNDLLKRYACELYLFVKYDLNTSGIGIEKQHEMLHLLHIDVLIELLKCDSFYISEDSIWLLCFEYCHGKHIERIDIFNTLDTYFGSDDPKLFNKSLMQKLIPFIRFEIIGVNYFASYIQPVLLKYNLLSESQLLAIHNSWHNRHLMREKFTLAHQRFDFETNYLTHINDVKVGDMIDVCFVKEQNNRDVCYGFTCFLVINMDDGVITIGGGNKFIVKFDDIIVAKPRSIADSINNRLPNLTNGRLVEFKTIDKINTKQVLKGRIHIPKVGSTKGEVRIFGEDIQRWFFVAANDPRLITG